MNSREQKQRELEIFKLRQKIAVARALLDFMFGLAVVVVLCFALYLFGVNDFDRGIFCVAFAGVLTWIRSS